MVTGTTMASYATEPSIEGDLHNASPAANTVTIDINDMTTAQMREVLSGVCRSYPSIVAAETARVFGFDNTECVVVDRRRGDEQAIEDIGDGCVLPGTQKRKKTTAKSLPTTRKRTAAGSLEIVPNGKPSKAATWDERLEELCQYKEQNGDANVPRTYPLNPPLGRWVSKQREEYKNWQQGKPASMNEEKAATLEKHGFKWRIEKYVSKASWEDRRQELREYKEKHGSFPVTRQGPLGRWMHTQRTAYKKFQAGEPSVMTAEKVEALNEIGFAWRIEKYNPTATWEERLDQLQEYKKEHGNYDVPMKYKENPALGAWVFNQRVQYRKILKGMPSQLTTAHMAVLNSVGFKWEKRRGSPKKKRISPKKKGVSVKKKLVSVKKKGGSPKKKRGSSE